MRESARSVTSWMVRSALCACQPANAAPSYSRPTAILPKAHLARAAPLAGQRLHEALGFLLLRGRTLGQHFLEDVACAVRIAHVHVGARQIELGADLAHGHRLEVR